jgi:hypothetical protein
MKLNNGDQMETITFHPTKDTHPILYANMVEDLIITSGVSEKEAQALIDNDFYQGITLEVYHHIEYGTFAVDPELTTDGNIYSPYSGEQCEMYDHE